MESFDDNVSDGRGEVSPSRRDAVVRLLRAFIAIVSSVILVGWLTGADWAVSKTSTVTMKANTAVALLVFACALSGTSERRRRVGGAIVGLIGLTALLEYLGKWSFGIDELIVDDPAGGVAPGRMAPTTASCFLLLAVTLLTLPSTGRTGIRIRTAAASTSLIIAFAGVVSFGLGSAPLLRFGPWVTMALPTALALVAASSAVMLHAPTPGVMLALQANATGMTLRRTLAAVLFLPFIAAWLAIQGERATWYDGPFAMALVTTITTAILAGVVWRTASVADRADELRLKAIRDLDRLAREHAVSEATQASDQRFRDSIDLLPESVSVFAAVRDDSGTIVDFRWMYANAASAAVTGFSQAQLEGQLLLEVLPHHGPSGMFDTYVQVVETGEPYVDPTLWYSDVWGDGVERRRAFDVRANRLEDGFVVVTKEVTEEREMAVELTRRTAELEQANADIMQLGDLGNLLQACSTTDEAFVVAGQTGELLFPDRSGALSLVAPDRNVVEPIVAWGQGERWPTFGPEGCWALRVGRPHISGPKGPRCEHLGPERTSACLCVPMSAQGEVVGILHLTGPHTPSDPDAPDFGETTRLLATTAAERLAVAIANLRLREMLLHQAVRDPLTGLFNRRYLEDTMERELIRAARSGSSVGVIQIDVDHFKEFNDTYGHDAGDAVLRSVAAAFGEYFRDSDIVCRFGGEEFTVVLPDSSPEVTERRAWDLRAHLRGLELTFDHGALPTPTISCGVATYPQCATTTPDLIRVADQALYAAKQAGRDRVVTAAEPPPRLSPAM